MSLFSIIKHFFASLFGEPSHEAGVKKELRAIENFFKSYTPALYRNGQVYPPFGEALYHLFVHTRRFGPLLRETVVSDDIRTRCRFAEALFFTNLSDEERQLYDSLLYDYRKKELQESKLAARTRDDQSRRMDKFLSSFNRPEFEKADAAVKLLEHFADICDFPYLTVLRIFDPDFSGQDFDSKPVCKPVAAESLSKACQELYYLLAGFSVTASMGSALVALEELKTRQRLADRAGQDILDHLKKVSYVLKHVLTADVLMKLAILAEKNPAVPLEKAEYKAGMLSVVAARLRERFAAEQKQIQMEIRDENIQAEVAKLFGDRPMETMEGYNADVNAVIRSASPVSFEQLTPFQIMKTFFAVYFDEPIQGLLNDIVIEGFFNNMSYKTEFSSLVYTCSEVHTRIGEFEHKFGKGEKYDQSVLQGYVTDSHKDTDFIRTLGDEVLAINKEAARLIQHETSWFSALAGRIGELLVDVKKSRSDVISNLHVLFSSTRNKESADRLEKQYPQWGAFLDIMSNYTVIQDPLKNHEK